MSLDKTTIEQIAWLARLSLSNEELDAYRSDLEQILDLVNQLDAAATSDITPLAHPLDLGARTRPDRVSETDQRDAFQALAPAARDGYYLVPKVID
jgi:aspartyl-tRNA(Asn)/glutamyl-tRNA(Gln) amidotransferase subunit C